MVGGCANVSYHHNMCKEEGKAHAQKRAGESCMDKKNWKSLHHSWVRPIPLKWPPSAARSTVLKSGEANFTVAPFQFIKNILGSLNQERIVVLIDGVLQPSHTHLRTQ